MKHILALLALALGLSFANAQAPVIVQPYNVTNFNASGTITVTNTFQSIWVATSGSSTSNSPRARAGCFIQNNSTHNMFVFFGPIASATTATSIVLAAGLSTTCNIVNNAFQDQVSITGTSGDAFYASQQ